MNKYSAATIDASLSRERGALGAAILDVTGKQAGILVIALQENDWLSSLHRQIFVAIRHLVGRNELLLEYLSVIAELQAMGVLSGFENGYSLISSLGEGIVLQLPMLKRVEQLRQMAVRRKLAKTLEGLCH